MADSSHLPNVTLSRRRVLGLGAALLSAGCSSRLPIGSDDDCASGFHISGEPFDPATDLVADLDEEGRRIVNEAVENGSAERTTYGRESLRDGIFVERDGSFYRTNVSTADVESVAAFRLTIEWESDREPPEDATVVAFEELPAADREALELAIYGSDERERHPSESLTMNDVPAPYPDGGGSSELVDGGVTWVRWDDRAYRVEVDGSDTTERHTFRYEVERVAAGAEEFRAVAASRYRIELDDLSADERGIVREALDDRYRECSPASDPLQGIQNRLPEDRRLPHPGDGWYVEFDGGEYQLFILQWER